MSRCYSSNLGQLILRVLAYQNTSQFPEAFGIACILTATFKDYTIFAGKSSFATYWRVRYVSLLMNIGVFSRWKPYTKQNAQVQK